MISPAGLVALLFTDLVGSTELLDRLGDDAGEELRRTHFSLLRQAVATFGGEEVKNLGDGLMVAFPSAIQATACAVAMQQAVAEHNRSQAAPILRVRIGLHAGEPFREEGDFFGTAVTVAKRLCDQAEGGQIMASGLVADLVGSRGGYRFRPAGRLTLKGLAQPLPAATIDWEAVATPPPAEAGMTPPKLRRARTPRGPKLVGRDRELADLDAELARAVAGEFRCVLLLSDPGVGKTRLAGELLSRHSPPAVGLLARAHPLGRTTSFGLWAEALESHLRALDASEVSRLCGGFVDDLAALLRSAAAVRALPPPAEPPRSRLLEGMAVLLGNLAEVAPIVVFLDDVHVADASSWDALHYLARNLPEAPVLVLAAARPAELHDQAEATQVLLGLEQDGLLRRLELRPLPTEAIGGLARAVLGQAPPPALVGWLNERCRGNPLFALGLLQALQDEGADFATPRLRRLPEALADRVIARLSSLDGPARSTLELLAVVGRRVELGNVVAFTGRPLDRVGPLLDGLVRSGLVTEEERGREVTYEIAHPLVQEAIYGDLGAARRHALHRLVARSLLSAGRLGEAAPHFARSAEVGDSEAIEALCGAVRQAEERELYREALTILGSLVELLPPGDERWLEVLDALVLEAEWVVDHRADVHAALAIPALRAIDSVLEGLPDLTRRATVKFRLCSFLAWGTGELEEAERAGMEARDLFEQAGDTQGTLLAALELGFIQGFKGDPAGWAAAGAQVAKRAEAAGERLVMMHALGRGIGEASIFFGRFDEGEAALRRAITIAREDGKVYYQSMCLAASARSLALEGRVAEAIPLLEEGKAVNPGWRESLLGEWEIMVHWLAGDFPRVLAGAEQAVSGNPAGMSRRRAIAMIFAALAGIETGELIAARRYLDLAQAAYKDRPWGIWAEYCPYAEAVFAWHRGDRVVALTGLRRTAETIQELGGWPWAAFVLLDLCDLAAESRDAGVVTQAAAELDGVAGRVDRGLYRALAALGTAWARLTSGASSSAAESAEDAVHLLSPLGCRFLLARALDVLGRSLAPLDRARALEALERAVATFDACGATWRRDRALGALRRLGAAGKRAAAALGPPVLTPREREVAALAARGRTAAEIARALFIGERTVESHLARIYAKLGVSSKHDLLQRASELGLADPMEPVGP